MSSYLAVSTVLHGWAHGYLHLADLKTEAWALAGQVKGHSRLGPLGAALEHSREEVDQEGLLHLGPGEGQERARDRGRHPHAVLKPRCSLEQIHIEAEGPSLHSSPRHWTSGGPRGEQGSSRQGECKEGCPRPVLPAAGGSAVKRGLGGTGQCPLLRSPSVQST